MTCLRVVSSLLDLASSEDWESAFVSDLQWRATAEQRSLTMLSWFTVRQLTSKDEYKRKEAAEKLGETGDTAAVEPLSR